MPEVKVLFKYGENELQESELLALRVLWRSELVTAIEVMRRGDRFCSLHRYANHKLNAVDLYNGLANLEKLGLVQSVPIELSPEERKQLGPRFKYELTVVGYNLMLHLSNMASDLKEYFTPS